MSDDLIIAMGGQCSLVKAQVATLQSVYYVCGIIPGEGCDSLPISLRLLHSSHGVYMWI